MAEPGPQPADDQPRRPGPDPLRDGWASVTLEFHVIDYEAQTGRPPYLALAGELPADPGHRRRLLAAVVLAAMQAYREECQLQSHGRLWDYPRR